MRSWNWLAPLSGVAVVVAYVALATLAWRQYTGGFGPRGNWLSDLGNPALNPRGAVFYRAAVVLVGVLLALFFAGLGVWRAERSLAGDPVGRRKVARFLAVAQLFGVLAALAALMTGVFPADGKTAHSVWSAVLYAAIGMAVWFVGWALLSVPRAPRGLSWFAFVVTVATFVFGVFYNRPWFEWLVVALLLVFVGLVALTTAVSFRSAAPQPDRVGVRSR